ncbi:MAG: caspase family protein [Fimbriimonadaceae bacterium]|nr:caspase family protein [Fimbriimonadaceae bacterium]
MRAHVIAIAAVVGFACFGLVPTATAGVVSSGRSAPGKRIAVLVGVSSYVEPEAADRRAVTPLRTPHLDAERLSQKLTQLGWETRLILSRPNATAADATRGRILAAIRNLRTSSEDTFLFYFSGHGARVGGEDYLVTFDSTLKRTPENTFAPDPETMLSFEALREAFAELGARQRVVIVDACRNEPGRSKDISGVNNANQAKVLNVVKASKQGDVSYVAMYSCKQGEQSWESPDLFSGKGGSVYTAGLLGALENRKCADADGNLVPALVEQQTKSFVANWCRANGRTMTPGSSSESFADTIFLGRLAGGDVRPNPEPQPENEAGVAILQLTGLPARAEVKVDGKSVSGGRYQQALAKGQTRGVDIQVFAAGYGTVMTRAVLEGGRTVTVPVKMTPEKEGAGDIGPDRAFRFRGAVNDTWQSVITVVMNVDGTSLRVVTRQRTTVTATTATGDLTLRDDVLSTRVIIDDEEDSMPPSGSEVRGISARGALVRVNGDSSAAVLLAMQGIVFPEQAIKPGERWTHEHKGSMYGSARVTSNYVFEREETYGGEAAIRIRMEARGPNGSSLTATAILRKKDCRLMKVNGRFANLQFPGAPIPVSGTIDMQVE